MGFLVIKKFKYGYYYFIWKLYVFGMGGFVLLSYFKLESLN